MEFLQNESNVQFALQINQQEGNPQNRSVYNPTTVPITVANNSAGTLLNNNRTEEFAPPERFAVPSPDDDDVFDEEAFKRLKPCEPVDIEFKNLSYTVKMGFGFNRATKEILHSISGKFPGGQLIAIMGPSGAGKSTLLDVLSGYRTTGVEGSIYTNGRRRDIADFRRKSCYITQDDRLQPLLTVMENMRIAAGLKLGPNVPYEQKESTIEEILLLLGLYDHDRTLAARLSGGQKKRLSIALEMINNPTIMFLDEPTSGLDSHSCTKVLELLKILAGQGRTVICTIHQPTAKLFQEFDQVYVLSAGECVYQGSSRKLVPFLQAVNLPCPMYHNPADYVIELACEEFGRDKVDELVKAMGNGSNLDWFEDSSKIIKAETLIRKYPRPRRLKAKTLEDTSFTNQLILLLKRGWIKVKRDTMLTHLRIVVNIVLAVMLGLLYVNAGNEGSRVLDNYNLLFAILINHSMTTMMLTVLTFPLEMSILLKEHFNRWYSLKAYFISVNLLDFPISFIGCVLFSGIIYVITGQPMDIYRFSMFFAISLLIVLVGQSIGFMIGAWCNVVNGTFFAPVFTVPMMMFAGFGVTLRDMPKYLKWGTHISYLRYGLEGFVAAIYGESVNGQKRDILDCDVSYCHYRYPKKLLEEVAMRGDQFWNDCIALTTTVVALRLLAYFLLRWKINAVK